MTDEADGDRNLLERWGEGDDAAGNQLVRRHFKRVYRFFRTKVPDVADDLTQATLLGAVEARDRFRGAASFRSFILAIARRQLLTYFRSKASDAGRWSAEDRSVADLAPTPSKVVAQTEREEILIRALQSISLDLQIALELRYWDGLTHPEIAEVLGVAVGTAKSRLNRAREELEDQLRKIVK